MADPLYTPLQPDQCGRFFLSPTVTLYYELRGISNHVKLVMLIGAMATCKLFAEFADCLAVKYQVLIFNYRGVGQGEKKSTYTGKKSCQTSGLLANDTLALMNHLWGPTAKIHVFGASMGGWIAQTVALKLVAQDRLASLMMSVTTRGNPISLPLPLCLCRFIVGKVVDRDISKHTKKMLEQCFDADVLSKVVIHASDGVSERTYGQLWLKEWTEKHDEYFTSRDLETSAAQVGLCVRHKFTKREAKTLRESKVPILVHVALHDKLMKPEQQQALARMLNANTLVTESGHMLGLDLRSTFQNAYEKFIDEASQQPYSAYRQGLNCN